ncbi:MAG TPA: DUF4332 domain-containing protein [Gemmatimonadales bacterium]|nr:DUF4332 domain-containing protein [Gemmatimonadales bacterium]
MTFRFRAPRVALGLPLAALSVAVAFALRELQIPPVPTWFYVFAWYPTLAFLDLLVYALGGDSLLDRPRELAAMLWWSAVIWFLFEAINFRLETWYYVFVPAHPVERWLGITVSFATVAPAILLPARLLERLGVGRALTSRPVAVRPRDLHLATALGLAGLGAALAWPRLFHPLVWGAVWLLAEPALYRTDPARSLFADVAAGRWGRIARLLLAGLMAGILWEAYNAGDRGKWIYTVPFLEDLKVFEMPLLGFLGFPFFALEVWTLYHLLAPRTGIRTVLPAALFVGGVLTGMDRRTVTSVTPSLAGLAASVDVRERLARAGFEDVFRLARTPPESLAARAGLSSEAAHAVREAARLATLRGIGTAHAARLRRAGVATVEELAAAHPDSLWSKVRGSYRPTRAEVREWIRAARAQAADRSNR